VLSAQCVARNVRHCGRKGWRVPEWWEYPSCLKGRPGATRQADAHSVARPTIGLCERLLGQFLAMRNPPLASRARAGQEILGRASKCKRTGTYKCKRTGGGDAPWNGAGAVEWHRTLTQPREKRSIASVYAKLHVRRLVRAPNKVVTTGAVESSSK